MLLSLTVKELIKKLLVIISSKGHEQLLSVKKL